MFPQDSNYENLLIISMLLTVYGNQPRKVYLKKLMIQESKNVVMYNVVVFFHHSLDLREVDGVCIYMYVSVCMWDMYV